MRTAILDFAALEAAAVCVSREETRYYLNGVCLEISPRSTFYVATDGHRMVTIRLDLSSDQPDNSLLGSFIVPADKCKPFKLTAREKTYERTVTLSAPDGDAGKLAFTLTRDNGESVSFKMIDGTFPDWRRVIPTEVENSLAVLSFNWGYLESFEKVAKVLGMSAPELEPGNNGPALLHYGPGDYKALGVLMPKRASATGKKGKPGWLDLIADPPAPEKLKPAAPLDIDEPDRYAMQGLTAAA